mgnify:CR=1 FL=1
MKRARSDEDKLKRRSLLLEAALDEFFERGFSAARMSDIAKRAELSKGTLYLYFDSKETLFQALIEELAAPNIDQLEDIGKTAQSLEEALDKFATFAPIMIRHSDVPRLMKVLIGDSHSFPNIVYNYRRSVIERLLNVIAEFIDRAVERGEIKPTDPHLTARLIVAPMALSGIWHALFGHLKDGHVDLETLFRMHADNLLAGLKREA